MRKNGDNKAETRSNRSQPNNKGTKPTDKKTNKLTKRQTKPETTTNDNIDIQSMKNELRNFLKKNIEAFKLNYDVSYN